MLQQRLLLLFVEGLDLIQVQQNTVGRHEGIQLRHNFLDIRSGGSGGIQLEQRAVGLFGDDIGNGGLTRTAGAIEDHIGYVPGVDETAQHRSLSQYMFLSVDLIQALRPEKIRQRLIHRLFPLSVSYWLL